MLVSLFLMLINFSFVVSVGAIGIIVAAVIFVLIVIIVLIAFCIKCCRNKGIEYFSYSVVNYLFLQVIKRKVSKGITSVGIELCSVFVYTLPFLLVEDTTSFLLP